MMKVVAVRITMVIATIKPEIKGVIPGITIFSKVLFIEGITVPKSK